MRLSPEQTLQILSCLQRQFGPATQVSVYGSRLDDAARGGDIDLLVEVERPVTLRQRAVAQMQLEQSLQLPIDLLVVQRGGSDTAFTRIARAKARPLEPA